MSTLAPPRSAPACIYEVGDVVKHRWEGDGKFYLGKVKTIEPIGQGYRCLVHYHGWSSRDDVWINDEDLDQRDRLQRACKNGKLEVVKQMIDQGVDIHAIDDESALGCYTALHWAAAGGRTDILKLLLARGASPNAADLFQGGPLQLAARDGHSEAVSLLLEHKASVNNQDDRGISPLHHAAEQGFEDVVKRLLMCENIKVNLQDSDGDTALHLAAHGINVIRGRQHKEVVSRLLSAGASVNIERKNGRRPFELTKSKEIRALLEPGAVCANIGDTPIPVPTQSRKRRAPATFKDEEFIPQQAPQASPLPRETFPETPQQSFATPRPGAACFGTVPDSAIKETQQMLDTKKKAPKPATLNGEDGERNRQSDANVTGEVKVQQQGVLADREIKLQRVMATKEVDIMLYGSVIGDTEMYRHRSNNSLLSGRFLRMWLLQHTMPSKHARTLWEKASVLFYEPTRLMGSAV